MSSIDETPPSDSDSSSSLSSFRKLAALRPRPLLVVAVVELAALGMGTHRGWSAASPAIDPSAIYAVVGVQSDKCLAVVGGSTAIRAPLEIRSCVAGGTQQFRFEVATDGYFRLRNVNSDLCVDVPSYSTTDGAPVNQYTCGLGQQNQEWTVTGFEPGAVGLTVRHSGKALDVAGQGRADGTPMHQWTVNNQPNQRFRLRVVGNDGGGGNPGQLGGGTAGAGGGGMAGGPASTGGSSATGGVAGSASPGGGPTGGAAGGFGHAPCAVVPVNPHATQAAKNLLCYLASQSGNHVLSGQQETSWSNPAGDIAYYVTNVGKYPAILGGDYLYPNGTSTRAIAYWNAGGIPMIRYHMGNPPNADSYQNALGSADLDKVITAGTVENASFIAKLDYVAAEIQKLEDAGVPLLWAPFHEVQPNGWFWWSKGSGSQYVALWKYMFNYLTSTKHLDNILWLLPFSGSPSSAYYPGKAFVDIAGPDTYGTNPPFTSNYQSARTVVGNSLPIALHETGTVPQPAQMFPATAPWLLFNVWAGFQTSANTVTTLRDAYASPFTVTRDEVPNLN